MPPDVRSAPEPATVGSSARRWLGALAGVALGAASAPVDLVAAAAPGAVLTDRRIELSDLALRRITRFHGPVGTDPLTASRCRRYLAARGAVGLLGAGVLLLLLLCAAVAASMISAWLLDGGWGLIENGADRVDTALIAVVAAPGALLVFVTAAGVVGVGALDRWVAARILGRRGEQELRRRVAELTSTRDEVVDVLTEERRRIERDLHDGVQQRLVALGMLIGRARRSERPEQLDALLRQAHQVSADAIGDLREVAHRVYPAALDSAGLAAALESLADRAPLPVELRYDVDGWLRPAVETVVYFVAAEAVTNAAKHAGARRVAITVADQPHARVLATVTDDGTGGADPAGPGLSGLARRVAAVDGTFSVVSPVGGPTVVTASVPCA